MGSASDYAANRLTDAIHTAAGRRGGLEPYTGRQQVLFSLAWGGASVIDPHGDLAEAIIDAIPPWRTHQVCYLNVADTDYPVGFNPLARVPAERRALAAAGVVSAFRHLWGDSWGPRLEHFLF